MFLYPFVFCILFVSFVKFFVKIYFVCKMFVKLVLAHLKSDKFSNEILYSFQGTPTGKYKNTKKPTVQNGTNFVFLYFCKNLLLFVKFFCKNPVCL